MSGGGVGHGAAWWGWGGWLVQGWAVAHSPWASDLVISSGSVLCESFRAPKLWEGIESIQLIVLKLCVLTLGCFNLLYVAYTMGGCFVSKPSLGEFEWRFALGEFSRFWVLIPRYFAYNLGF